MNKDDEPVADATLEERVRRISRAICIHVGVNPSGPAPHSQGERVLTNVETVRFWLRELTTPQASEGRGSPLTENEALEGSLCK